MLRSIADVTLWLTLLVLAAAFSPFAVADDYHIPPARKDHWAWKPPARPDLPRVTNRAWVRNPIDAFILAKLEAAGVAPAAPATQAQLIRRVTFDLIGLPPTPQEVDAFLADPAPEAWEKVIDRLLASPHYGERWGRHWLDLARFAESNGYEHDEIRPDAWRYRDYVIRSFNRDKPYDRFLREQLAGDELYPDDPEALIATGFNLLGPDMTDTSDQTQRRQNTLDDMTETAGLAVLGLTIGCARCHDHKFEPIPQSDFYRLEAFFSPAAFRHDLPIAEKQERAAHAQAERAYAELVKPTQEAIAALEEPYRQKLYAERLAKLADEARAAHLTPEARRTPAQQELVAKTNRLLAVAPKSILASMSKEDRVRDAELQAQLKQFDAQKPRPLPMTLGLEDMEKVPKTFVLERGELGHHAEEVQPGFPIILSPGYQAVPAAVSAPWPTTTGRRTALANWIVSGNNALTARVLVNRLWQRHFGRGIVATPNDFGVRGERPTHPELLDYLATEFVARGWSIKAMHKLMLMSVTYQQSASASAEVLAKDPGNELFSRMNRLRLEGEIIRDTMLAASGRLNPQMGGPGVFPPVPPGTFKGGMGGWTVSRDPRDHVRRSVYIFARRNLRFPFLETFDLPDSNLSCPKREQSTTAPQALALLNGQDVLDAAHALAARLTGEAATGEERIVQAYRLVLGRAPTMTERQGARAFLAGSPLSELCRALFNANEFIYLD
jgi:hypothetical protein